MSANEIHQGDIGTILRLTVKDGTDAIDLSAATTKEIVLRKPSGSMVTKDATFTTDGSDGQIQYTTVADDLDEAGIWRIQARVVLLGGTWRTDIARFEVYENL